MHAVVFFATIQFGASDLINYHLTYLNNEIRERTLFYVWVDNVLFRVSVLEAKYICSLYIIPSISIADWVHTVDNLAALMFFEREYHVHRMFRYVMCISP